MKGEIWTACKREMVTAKIDRALNVKLGTYFSGGQVKPIRFLLDKTVVAQFQSVGVSPPFAAVGNVVDVTRTKRLSFSCRERRNITCPHERNCDTDVSHATKITVLSLNMNLQKHLKLIKNWIKRTASRSRTLKALQLQIQRSLFFNRTNYSELTMETLEGLTAAVVDGLVGAGKKFCLILAIIPT